MRSLFRAVGGLSGLSLVLACGCQTIASDTHVQPSVQAKAGAVVEFGEDGTLSTPCLTVEVGTTVEWRNLSPAVPVNVTSLSDPPALFSPNLSEGYQLGTQDGKTFSWWRYTFAKPGVYEYFDTNSGEPGKKVVDPYYGTVTYVGLSPTLPTGVVCVHAPGSRACVGVCCVKNNDGSEILSQGECPSSQCCDPKRKRCLLGSPNAAICAPDMGPVGQAAHRSFQCFAESDCPTGKTCRIENDVSHVCSP